MNKISTTFSTSYSEEEAEERKYYSNSVDELQSEREESEEDLLLIQLLAKQACHLPGNTWMQDWLQFIFYNNHTLFGLCCHNRLHPVNTMERFAILLASISFGLAVSSGIRLFFYYFVDDNDMEIVLPMMTTNESTSNSTMYANYSSLMPFQFLDGNYTEKILNTTEEWVNGGDSFVNVTQQDHNFIATISYEEFASWTIGGALNTLFDLISWNLSACACCLPGGRLNDKNRFSWCNTLGSVVVVIISLIITAATVFITILRANTTNATTAEQRYAFIFPYLIQVLLSWFFYYPVVQTIIFSGILGCCGLLPILGGRPREIRLLQNKKEMESMSQPETSTSIVIGHVVNNVCVSKESTMLDFNNPR
jgi:hypothetical protein